MMHWPGSKLGHLPSFSSCWEAFWSWRWVLIMKVEWCWHRWKGVRTSRPSWFDVPFGDGLGNQLLAFTQAYRIDTKLGLFANPTDSPWQHECGILCHTQVLLLMIATHRTEWPSLDLSLLPLSGQICYHIPRLPQLAPARCEGVVVLLPHIWWMSPVFPNNTKTQTNQVLVSLPETGMVNMKGCSQMPQDFQGHSGCLVVWGCGPQSGY